ncbi:hypothetical protein Tfu_1659 [Thermobifida fusca YX]|uniref:DUF4440 domain-containing protein n=1 Tax=Thermobifida fusca (strain YX) TaxID=269800 RepID=Q47PC5_THEFY|nr:hypothetical protein Tfu_1659 [Thermobifida fusca YX]
MVLPSAEREDGSVPYLAQHGMRPPGQAVQCWGGALYSGRCATTLDSPFVVIPGRCGSGRTEDGVSLRSWWESRPRCSSGVRDVLSSGTGQALGSTRKVTYVSQPGLFNDLLRWEQRGWDALCAGTGADFYTSLMTEDGVMVLANGLVLDRAAVAVSLNETPPWSGYEISDARLVAAGDDSAILVYTGAAYRAGEPSVFRALMSSVYVRQQDRWRLALYQQTPLPGPEVRGART